MINSDIHRSADTRQRYDSSDMPNYNENAHSRNHHIVTNVTANDDNDSEDISSWNYNLNCNFDNTRIVKHGRYPNDWYIEFGHESYLQLKFRAVLSYFRVYTIFRLLQSEQVHEYFCDSNWMWNTNEPVSIQSAILHDLQIEEKQKDFSSPLDLDSFCQTIQKDTIASKNSRNAVDFQEKARILSDSEDTLHPTQPDGSNKTPKEVLNSEKTKETNDICLLPEKSLAKTNVRRRKLKDNSAFRKDLEKLDDRLYSARGDSISSSRNLSRYQVLLNLLNRFADFKKSVNSKYLRLSKLLLKSTDAIYLEQSAIFENTAESQHSSNSENTTAEHVEDLSNSENSIDSEQSASSEHSTDSEHSSNPENPTDSEQLASAEDPTDSEHSSNSENSTDTEHTTSSEHSADSKHSSNSQNSTDSEHSTSSEHSTDSKHSSNPESDSQHSSSSEHSAGLEHSINPKGPMHSECLASATKPESPDLSRNVETPEILQNSESHKFSTAFEETELFEEDQEF
ncbi:Halomucin [Dirofilaria immitis]